MGSRDEAAGKSSGLVIYRVDRNVEAKKVDKKKKDTVKETPKAEEKKQVTA